MKRFEELTIFHNIDLNTFNLSTYKSPNIFQEGNDFYIDDRTARALRLDSHHNNIVASIRDLRKYFTESGVILDVGCSTGDFVNRCLAVGFSAFGVDVRNENWIDVPCIQADAHNLPWIKDNQIAAVHARAVFDENIYSIHSSFLDEVHRILSPNGFLFTGVFHPQEDITFLKKFKILDLVQDYKIFQKI